MCRFLSAYYSSSIHRVTRSLALQTSALKLGDDPDEGKLIIDPRCSPADRQPLLSMVRAMAAVRQREEVDASALSKVRVCACFS